MGACTILDKTYNIILFVKYYVYNMKYYREFESKGLCSTMTLRIAKFKEIDVLQRNRKA